MQRYPFRFYGRHPLDWADDFYQYDLQFSRTPTAQQKHELARCFATTLATGAAIPQPGWRWAGRFALFSVTERWPNAARMAFSKVADFLIAAHWICPINDVVFWGAEGSKRGWDLWTVETQAEPDPGPDYQGGTHRPVDPALPVPELDEGFEAALEEVAAQRRRDYIQAISSGEGLGLDPIQLPEPGKTPEDVPPGFEVPEPLLKESGANLAPCRNDGDHVILLGPRPVARVYKDNAIQGMAYLDNAGQRQLLPLPDAGIQRTVLAVDQEGARGLACNSSHHLYAVDFAAGQVTQSWQAEGKDGAIIAVGFIGALWVVRTRAELLILDPGGERPVEVARARIKGDYLYVVRDETVLVTGLYGKSVAFFGFAEGKLKKLGGFKVDLHPWLQASQGHGQLILRKGSEAHVVTNLDRIYEAFAAPLREKAERARRRALKKKKKKKKKTPVSLSLVAVSRDELTDVEPPVTEGERLMLGRRHGIKVSKALDGTMAALLSSPGVDDPGETRFSHFVFTTKDGPVSRVHDLTEKVNEVGHVMPMCDVDMTADGALAFVLTTLTQKILEIDLAQRSVALAYQGDPEEGGKRVVALRALDGDNLLLLRAKRLDWISRTEQGWVSQAHARVSSPCELTYHAPDRVAIVRGTGKKRAQFFALQDGTLLPLGSLTERIEQVLVFADGVAVLTFEQELFKVLNIRGAVQSRT